MNVFDSIDSDSNDDIDSPQNSNSAQANFGRKAVNKSIKAEQVALRLRAEAALKDISTKNQGDDIYAYDEVYDSIHGNNGEPNESKKVTSEEHDTKKKESRYIQDLLQASEKRKKDLEIIYNRRVVQQQEKDYLKDGIHTEEKYITATYKRKLQERDLWLADQKQQDENDQKNDITNKHGAEGQFLVSRFFGNNILKTKSSSYRDDTALQHQQQQQQQERGNSNTNNNSNQNNNNNNNHSSTMVVSSIETKDNSIQSSTIPQNDNDYSETIVLNDNIPSQPIPRNDTTTKTATTMNRTYEIRAEKIAQLRKRFMERCQQKISLES